MEAWGYTTNKTNIAVLPNQDAFQSESSPDPTNNPLRYAQKIKHIHKMTYIRSSILDTDNVWTEHDYNQSLVLIYLQSQSRLSTVTVHLFVYTGNTTANSMCCMYASVCVWGISLQTDGIGGSRICMQRRARRRVVGGRTKGHLCVPVRAACMHDFD